MPRKLSWVSLAAVYIHPRDSTVDAQKDLNYVKYTHMQKKNTKKQNKQNKTNKKTQ